MEWQPIKTAPIDGTPILVWLVDTYLGSHVHAATFRPNMRCIGGGFDFDAPLATHWQLQPAGPNIQAGLAEALIG